MIKAIETVKTPGRAMGQPEAQPYAILPQKGQFVSQGWLTFEKEAKPLCRVGSFPVIAA